MIKQKTVDLELALSRFFNYRTNLIVPNISWGLDLHECDLLILSKAGYATEVEIKISKADLKKDIHKGHGHISNRIKYFYYAVPQELSVDYVETVIPDRAGIIRVFKNNRCQIVRDCEINKKAIKFSNEDRLQMARLGALRIWSLKRKLRELTKNK